jgi:ATP-binding protein involved in chromosome partitioning
MSQVTPQQVQAALVDFPDPESGRKIGQSGQLRDVKVDGARVSVTIGLTSHSASLKDETRDAIRSLLRAKFPALAGVDVNFVEQDRPPQKLGQIGLTAKSVIAVGSGKGGVGKSTIAASIALGLKRAGSKVGLLDADVYGPSIPHLLGVSARPEDVVKDNKYHPVVKDGLPVMSIGFLVPPSQAVIWRGPMLHHTMTAFLGNTAWGDLDFLIVDMPPGTGDVALSMSQLLPVTGAVVVCTPQTVALLDAVKAIGMFRTVKIPVLGMVENMSGFICPDCGKRYDIFGSGGAKAKAEELGVPLLGEVPLEMSIRTSGDAGRAGAVFDSPATRPYFEQICRNLVKTLSQAAAEAPPLPSLSVL